jgi:hypothetical protein
LHEALVPVNIVKVRVLAAALPLLRKGVGWPELVHNITCAGAKLPEYVSSDNKGG